MQYVTNNKYMNVIYMITIITSMYIHLKKILFINNVEELE